MDTLIATQKMVPLAPFTTLEVGGPARDLLIVGSEVQAFEAVRWWRELPLSERRPLLFLGGGSNLLVGDGGFDGLVLKMENFGIEETERDEKTVVLKVGAGTVWDDLVAHSVAHGYSGLECLSGIPGTVGAAPVQNIGAYGQEVSETVVSVDGIDIETGQRFQRSRAECEFRYRDSLFKRAGQGRYLITSVSFALEIDGVPTIRYQDLFRRVDELTEKTLSAIRNLVLEIRRSKSMVYDKSDPNHRSAGSFFTNPVVPTEAADRIQSGLPPELDFPRFPQSQGFEKLSAAWLIDKAGLGKGFCHREGARVSLSTNHVLALTNRGGATATELIELCEHVKDAVRNKFGVELEPEPNFVGSDFSGAP